MFPGNAFVSLVQANHMIDVLGVGQSGRRQVEVSSQPGGHVAARGGLDLRAATWRGRCSFTLPVSPVPCLPDYAAHSRKTRTSPDWFPNRSRCVPQVASKLDPGIMSRFIIFVRQQQAQQKAAGSSIGDSGGANMDLLGCDALLLVRPCRQVTPARLPCALLSPHYAPC